MCLNKCYFKTKILNCLFQKHQSRRGVHKKIFHFLQEFDDLQFPGFKYFMYNTLSVPHFVPSLTIPRPRSSVDFKDAALYVERKLCFVIMDILYIIYHEYIIYYWVELLHSIIKTKQLLFCHTKRCLPFLFFKKRYSIKQIEP